MEPNKNGIICLETEWNFKKRKLQDKYSSEPLLMFLKNYHNIDYIYRRVATKAELEYYLKEFRLKAFSKYGIFYFSFHGEKNSIVLEGEKRDENEISLNDLAEMSRGAFENKIVHFSSCRTFIGSEKPMKEFKEQTKALIISGYRKSVDAMISAIHDIAYFNELQNRSKMGLVKSAMEKLYGELAHELGFEIIY